MKSYLIRIFMCITRSAGNCLHKNFRLSKWWRSEWSGSESEREEAKKKPSKIEVNGTVLLVPYKKQCVFLFKTVYFKRFASPHSLLHGVRVCAYSLGNFANSFVSLLFHSSFVDCVRVWPLPGIIDNTNRLSQYYSSSINHPNDLR